MLGCAAVETSRARGCAATLGLTLYRSLEFSKKKKVKKAVRTRTFVLTSTKDHRVDQMQVVQQIIDLVAKYSTIDRLRRIMRLHKEISACKWNKNECISE